MEGIPEGDREVFSNALRDEDPALPQRGSAGHGFQKVSKDMSEETFRGVARDEKGLV